MKTKTDTIPSLVRIAGMIYQRRNDGIHVFRFTDSRRATADAWAAQTHQNDLNAAASHEHLCILLDIRGVWLTPYIASTAIKTVNMTPPGLLESTAVVVKDNLMLGLLVGVMRKLPNAALASTRLFTDEKEALAWLVERQTLAAVP